MEGLGAGFSLVVFIFLLTLAILMVLMPFFVYGTNQRTKETALALKETNKLLADIRDELAYARKQSERASEPTTNNPPKNIKPETNQNTKSKPRKSILDL